MYVHVYIYIYIYTHAWWLLTLSGHDKAPESRHRCVQNKHPFLHHALGFLSPLPPNINVEGDATGSGSSWKTNTQTWFRQTSVACTHFSTLNFGEAGAKATLHAVLLRRALILKKTAPPLQLRRPEWLMRCCGGSLRTRVV